MKWFNVVANLPLLSACLTKPRTAKTHVAAILLASLLPLLVFSIFVGERLWQSERAAAANLPFGKAQALSASIDSKLQSVAASLSAFAAAIDLDDRTNERFREQCLRLAKLQHGWIFVISRDREELLTTCGIARPPSSPQLMEFLAREPWKTETGISIVFNTTTPGHPQIAVVVPALSNGKARYLVGIGLPIEVIHAEVVDQNLPKDWTVEILDSRGAAVGDNPAPNSVSAADTYAPPRDLLAPAHGASLRTTADDAGHTDTVALASGYSGWATIVRFPRAQPSPSVVRPLVVIFIPIAMLILGSLLFALVVGRHFSQSLEKLSAAALAIGQSVPLPPIRSVVKEVNDVVAAQGIAARILSNRMRRRAEAERALKESEQRFRDIAEVSGDWIWEMGPDLRFTLMSAKGLADAGEQDNEVIGLTAWQIANVDPEQDEHWAKHKAHLDSRKPFRDFRYSLTIRSGEKRHLVVSGKPIFNERDEFVGYRGAATDETKTVEMESEARHRTAILQAMIDNFPAGVSVMDDDLSVVLFNQRLLDLLELPPNHFQMGDPLEKFLRYNAERGDYGTGNSDEQVRQRIELARQFLAHKFERTLSSGKVIQIQGAPLPGFGFVTIYTDMTAVRDAERTIRESEARFRDIAEVAGDLIWELDANFRFTYLAGAGRNPEDVSDEEILGRTRWDFAKVDPERDQCWVRHKADLEAHRPFRHFRYSTTTRGGRVKYFCVSGKPFYDGNGNFHGYRGTSTNETEIIEARNRAEHAEATLRDAVDSLPDGFVIFDRDDRLVICNAAYANFFPDSATVRVPGASFEEIIRDTLKHGRNAEALGREEEWLAERQKQHLNPGSPIERRLADGRWVLVTERRTRNGGIAGLRVDITALKQAEFAMQRSEQRFRDFAEVTGDWIWEMDSEFRFVQALTPDRDTTPLGERAVIGRTRWELAGAGPESNEHWRAHRADMEARRAFRRFRYSVIGKDGEPIYLSVSGKPVFDERGVFVGYRGTTSNETEMVTARQRAEAAEILLNDAVASISEGFVIYDREDRFVLCNERYRQLYPLSNKFMISGTTFENILRGGLKEGQYADAIGREEAWLAERLRHHREASVALEQPHGDGRWLLITERRMRNGGIAGLRVDITKLKDAQAALRESEARLDRAQKIAGLGSWEHDVRTDHCVWSSEMYRIRGIVAERCAQTGRGLVEHVYAEDVSLVRDWLRRLKGGDSPAEIEFRILRPDGALRVVDAQAEPIFDGTGAVIKIAGTLKDVTDLRESEKARRDLQTQLQHSQRLESLGTLAGGIAHDLNNTLQPVLALAKVALKTLPAGSAEREDMELIQNASLRARDLVRQILAFSRKEGIERQSIDLAAVTRQALGMLRASIPTTITIVQAIDNLPSVFGDPGQIHQVLVNLVTNASHAIGNEKGVITVTLAERHSDQASGVRVAFLCVRDTGCGMDESTVNRIFEPFFTTKKVGEGTGLGLSVVHGIVAKHGGAIEVESRLGQGTCFMITLPFEGGETTPVRIEERINA